MPQEKLINILKRYPLLAKKTDPVYAGRPMRYKKHGVDWDERITTGYEYLPTYSYRGMRKLITDAWRKGTIVSEEPEKITQDWHMRVYRYSTKTLNYKGSRFVIVCDNWRDRELEVLLLIDYAPDYYLL